MNLTQVSLFFGCIVIYHLLLDQKGKIWVILAASICGVFWLQPGLLIRNFDYWFPFLSISLILITWLVITSKDNLKTKENIFSFLIIIAISLLIPLSRYLPFEFKIIPTVPPQPVQVIIAVFILFIWLIIFYLSKIKVNTSLVCFILILILLLFIILKNPLLNSKISIFLKMVSGQSTNTIMAQGGDLRWLGFSYIAFRLIHTLRDFQNKRYQSTNLCTYFSYVLFFPALIAGPIDRIEHFEKEIRKRSEKSQDFIVGGKRLIIGLIRKFVIADALVLIAINSNNAILVKSPIWLWVMLVAYAWMIYFDFSGYTDIALGLSSCIGIVLPENFDRPYSAKNLALFWNKWHMSLTQWFRSYFFNPITRFLRTRKKPLPPTIIVAITQILTMTLIGLWHGVSWNYLYWGLWHGLGLFIQNRWANYMQKYQGLLNLSNPIQRLLSTISVIFTFVFISLGWIWFVTPDPQISFLIFKKLFGFD